MFWKAGVCSTVSLVVSFDWIGVWALDCNCIPVAGSCLKSPKCASLSHTHHASLQSGPCLSIGLDGPRRFPASSYIGSASIPVFRLELFVIHVNARFQINELK